MDRHGSVTATKQCIQVFNDEIGILEIQQEREAVQDRRIQQNFFLHPRPFCEKPGKKKINGNYSDKKQQKGSAGLVVKKQAEDNQVQVFLPGLIVQKSIAQQQKRKREQEAEFCKKPGFLRRVFQCTAQVFKELFHGVLIFPVFCGICRDYFGFYPASCFLRFVETKRI